MSGTVKTNVFTLNKMYQVILDCCIGVYNGDPGELWVWGYNVLGELGDNTIVNKSSPIQIPGTTWIDISGGGSFVGFSLARKTDGTLWSWGTNGTGQLGDGTILKKSSPVQIPGTTWNDIAAGSNHSLARKTDGTLWAWGSNTYGPLGDGTVVNKSSPIQIPGTTWNDIATGTAFSLARKTDGTLWAWGDNSNGQLGQNNTITRSSPVQIPGTSWNDIAALGYSLARKTDGTLWSWGINQYGQLGDGTVVNKSSPIQIPGTTWNDIAAGTGFSLARKTDGTLWSWGVNAYGTLGDGTVVWKSSPIQIPGTTWNDIAAAVSGDITYALARKTDGTLWAWGDNSNGQLGDGTVINKSSPVQIPGTKWNDIAAGYAHALARKIV
jgi:alpha-tubulin suppressor-like RCC1 family protein